MCPHLQTQLASHPSKPPPVQTQSRPVTRPTQRQRRLFPNRGLIRVDAKAIANQAAALANGSATAILDVLGNERSMQLLRWKLESAHRGGSLACLGKYYSNFAGCAESGARKLSSAERVFQRLNSTFSPSAKNTSEWRQNTVQQSKRAVDGNPTR